jgi:1,4-dihydroxy-2-naphthoate polyprenyltransferase
MATAKDWITAARPRTLPLAIANIAMGGTLAAYFGDFNGIVFACTVITAICLQILSNLANDYGDHINGADHIHREGPDRAVQSGAISPSVMKKAMALMTALSLIFGITLIYLSPITWQAAAVFLGLGFVSIWAAINYTAGSNPYGYRALGDVSVFLFFGLLSVMGCFYLQLGRIEWSIILPAISCGVFSMAVLNINNIRDIESDTLAGKVSLAIKLGRTNATRYHLILLTIGILAAAIFSYMHFSNYWQFLFLITIPLLLINYNAVKLKNKAMELDPFLKQMALTTLLFVITFSLGLLAF